MRILIFHGYLLGGTGSNVYNARLTRTLVSLGHEVHLLTQDRHPEDHDFVDEVATWTEGRLTVTPLDRAGGVVDLEGPPGEPGVSPGGGPHREGPSGGAKRRGRGGGRCVVYRPDIGALLPVYVEDPYEGIEARAFPRCTESEIDRYIQANVDAVCEVVDRVGPEIALANHLIMAPVILARALGSDRRTPYIVKVHGSALEYTVKPNPDRFLGYALEGLSRARAVLVGSRHTARSLWEVIGDPKLSQRTFLGPPGVDVERFTPVDLTRGEKAGHRVPVLPAGEGGDHTQVDPPTQPPKWSTVVGGESDGPVVAFVGKLIVNKGIDLLVAGWPLVLQGAPDARLAVIGFGALQDSILSLIDALADGDIERVRALALAGRTLEGPRARRGDGLRMGGEGLRMGGEGLETEELKAEPSGGSLNLLLAFLDDLTGDDLERYLVAAGSIRERIVMVGRLEHPDLARVLPWCEAIVVPSTFPEAFGMVAVEGAACGSFPITANHSGLAEVSATLAEAVGDGVARWLSFEVDSTAVRSLAGCVLGWLSADPDLKAKTREALVSEVRDRWSWEGVAHMAIAAARGQFDGLTRP